MTKRIVSVFMIVCVVAGTGPALLRAQQSQEQRGATTIEAVAEEVLLDLVARDKRGRPIHDLKPEEVEVYENGVKQPIIAFRYIERNNPLDADDAARRTVGAEAPIDPLRHVNLVSLVFERLGTEGRQLARQGALDFLKNELRENVLVAIFTIDQRMHVIQQFTNDREALKKAIERVTSGGFTQFASESDKILQELETLRRTTAGAQASVALAGQGASPGDSARSNFRNAKLAELTLNILRFAEEMQGLQQGRSSLFSLLSLVNEQRLLAGRKTVIYFSEGLHVPPSLVEHFRGTISAANRANVSFYAVDSRGLRIEGQMGSTRDLMQQAAGSSASQVFGANTGVTRDQVLSAETAEATLRADIQGTMGVLARETGGLLVANTNDLRTGMRQVAEDIAGYYEITYRPPSGGVYDGSFRKIDVRVLREDVKVQARSGYFAVPVIAGAPTLPFETQMLAALAAEPLPRAFDYRAQAVRFGPAGDGIEHSLAIEVPLNNFQFSTDEKAAAYNASFSVMALIKDANGQIVRKISQNYPLQGPLANLDALKRGDLLFSRNLSLPPGRYTVETVALDRQASKASARRTVLIVPPHGNQLRISSVSLVKRADQLPPDSAEADDPWRYENVRLVPMLNGEIRRGPKSEISLYVVVYPQANAADRPSMEVQFLRDGELIARSPIELPAPDAEGRIQLLGSMPVEALPPGQYQLRAVVRQGGATASEYALLTLTGDLDQGRSSK